MQTLNLGAQGAGMHSFDWPAGTATDSSGLTFRVTATAGGVAIASTALMRDRVDAVTHQRQQLQPRAREVGLDALRLGQGPQLNPVSTPPRRFAAAF